MSAVCADGVLWRAEAFAAAAGGRLIAGEGFDPETAIAGISIDTRTLAADDVFVALVDQRDGHDFLDGAFAAGARVALVHKAPDAVPTGCAVVLIDDTLRGLERVGVAARARMAGGVAAITGSVGKTGSKEALRHALGGAGPTHAPEKSFNNHWGVPLTLARMPAETAFGVFEIGMNHPGEISPLVQMVQPQVAMITTIAPVHLGAFPDVAAIADAKAEIFDGLATDGIAVLNRDNAYFDHLADKARGRGINAIIGFGEHGDAQARLLALVSDADGSSVTAEICGTKLAFWLAQAGRHHVQNALGVLAVCHALGVDLKDAAGRLSDVGEQAGRGARQEIALAGGGSFLLIDESYNANPASMAAALDVLATVASSRAGRSIAILGDMLELGAQSGALHGGLAGVIADRQIDLVFTCGSDMRHLHEALEPSRQGDHAPASDGLVAALEGVIQEGDVVMVKGSLGSRMARVVDALTQKRAAA